MPKAKHRRQHQAKQAARRRREFSAIRSKDVDYVPVQPRATQKSHQELIKEARIAEYALIRAVRWPVVRKTYSCQCSHQGGDCGTVIEPGTRYQRVTLLANPSTRQAKYFTEAIRSKCSGAGANGAGTKHHATKYPNMAQED